MLETLSQLTKFHKENCSLYRDFVNTLFGPVRIENLEDVPFLPVKAFKELKSRVLRMMRYIKSCDLRAPRVSTVRSSWIKRRPNFKRGRWLIILHTILVGIDFQCLLLTQRVQLKIV